MPSANVIFGDFSDYLLSLYNQLSDLLSTKVTKGGDVGPLTVGTTNDTPLTLRQSGYDVTMPTDPPSEDSVLAAQADGALYWAAGALDAIVELAANKVTKGGDAETDALVVGTTTDEDVVLVRDGVAAVTVATSTVDFGSRDLYLAGDLVWDAGLGRDTYIGSPSGGRVAVTANGVAGPYFQSELKPLAVDLRVKLDMGLNDLVLTPGGTEIARGNIRFDLGTMIHSPGAGQIAFTLDDAAGPVLAAETTGEGDRGSVFMGVNDVVFAQGSAGNRGRIRYDDDTFVHSPGDGQIAFTVNNVTGPVMTAESTGEGAKGSVYMGVNDVVLAQGGSGSRGRVRFDAATFVSSPSLGNIAFTLNGVAGPACVAGLTSEGLKGNLLMGRNDIMFEQGGFGNRGRILYDDDTFVYSGTTGHVGFVLGDIAGPQLAYENTYEGEKGSVFMDSNDVVFNQGSSGNRGRIRYDEFTSMYSPGAGEIAFTLDGVTGPVLAAETTGEGDRGSMFMGVNDVVFAQGSVGNRGRIRYDSDTFVHSPGDGQIAFTVNNLAGPVVHHESTGEGNKGNVYMGVNDVVFAQGGSGSRGRVRFDAATFVSSPSSGKIAFQANGVSGPVVQYETTAEGDKASLVMGVNDVVFAQGGSGNRGRIRYDDDTFVYSPADGQIAFKTNNLNGPTVAATSGSEGSKGSVLMDTNDILFAASATPGSRGRICLPDENTFIYGKGSGKIATKQSGTETLEVASDRLVHYGLGVTLVPGDPIPAVMQLNNVTPNVHASCCRHSVTVTEVTGGTDRVFATEQYAMYTRVGNIVSGSMMFTWTISASTTGFFVWFDSPYYAHTEIVEGDAKSNRFHSAGQFTVSTGGTTAGAAEGQVGILRVLRNGPTALQIYGEVYNKLRGALVPGIAAFTNTTWTMALDFRYFINDL